MEEGSGRQFGTVAGPIHDELMSAVCEAVEGGVSEDGVGEGGGPDGAVSWASSETGNQALFDIPIRAALWCAGLPGRCFRQPRPKGVL